MSGIIEQPRFSCALGAQQTVLAIPKGIPVVHAGPGCAGKIFTFTSQGAGHQGEGYAGGGNISCTNATEKEVIFGGENKLNDLVEGILKVIKGDLYVILSGCTSGIIGDDVESVAEDFASRGLPVVGVETSGFKGNNYYGHELVVNEIINQFVGDRTPKVRSNLVNVFSVVPYQDAFWRGDLDEIKRLLTDIGLEVNILFGQGSAGVSEWRDIPNAAFNLVLSPWVGLKTAELLQEKYGTPFLHYPILPVGAKATSKFLRSVGAYAKLPGNQVEEVIKREEARFYNYIVVLGDFIVDMTNNIPFELYTVADSSYAIGVSDYLVNELGCLPKGVYLIDEPTKEHLPVIKETVKSLGKDFEGTLLIEPDGGLIQADIREKIGNSGKAVILGSSWEVKLARENQNEIIRLSLPIIDEVVVSRSYVGYNGGLRLTEDYYTGAFKRGGYMSQVTLAQE